MVACFTGRRPKDLCGYAWSSYEKFQYKFFDYLELLYQQGYRKFITGGAQGFDQLAFWAVNALKAKYPDVENIVYVPHKGQAEAWGNNPKSAFNKQEYYRMLDTADSVVYLVNEIITDYKTVCASLFDRNHKMVNDADLVVALYPNDLWSSPTTKGGTAECMRYAKKKHKTIARINYLVHNNELIFGEVVAEAS